MSEPPRRVTENGTELVLISPADRRLKPEERQALSLEPFREMENELLDQSTRILSDSLAWPEITAETEEPPAEWVATLGPKKAAQKLRVAKAAWMPTKEAPVGLKMAQATVLGIARLRAGDRQENQKLNVQIVQVVESKSYEEMEVEERK